MPLFHFTCSECGYSKRSLKSSDTKTLDCENCGGILERELPTELSSEVMEMRDKYRGVQLPKNREADLKRRHREHHDKYEVAEKIDKQGIETADRLGWSKKKK